MQLAAFIVHGEHILPIGRNLVAAAGTSIRRWWRRRRIELHFLEGAADQADRIHVPAVIDRHAGNSLAIRAHLKN